MIKILLACFACLAANTWYVDASGTPPGLGTLANPYTDIQYAINQPATHVGDTILVAPGEYQGFSVQGKYLLIRGTQGAMQTRIQTSIFVANGLGIEGLTLADGGSVFDSDVRECVILGSGLFIKDIQQITHCVFWGCTKAIGDHAFDGGGVQIDHCVFWNCAIGISTVAPGTVQYCAGQTTPGGFGWIVLHSLPGDPLLWDPAMGDMRLRPGSPCIDAGDPSAPLDPDGTRADIGLIPYDPSYAPAPTSYCTGKLNSQGCTPAIGAIGSASASSGGPFVITAANEVDNKVGLMLMGFGKLAQPFQAGLLCIQSPIKRLGPQNSLGNGPCTGTYAFDMAAYITSGIHPGLVPGALVDCQWWGRDPLDPSGFGSQLSNALSFGIAP